MQFLEFAKRLFADTPKTVLIGVSKAVLIDVPKAVLVDAPRAILDDPKIVAEVAKNVLLDAPKAVLIDAPSAVWQDPKLLVGAAVATASAVVETIVENAVDIFIERESRKDDTLKKVEDDEPALWRSENDVAESKADWEKCCKNRGHHNFIDIRDFGSEHLHRLPKKWQTYEFVELVRAWADLTVRLRVKYTSSVTPELSREFYDPGNEGWRVGTGFVLRVERNSGDLWKWTLYLGTAKHVVYDDEETTSMKVDFFYDYPEALKDGTTKTLEPKDVVRTDDRKDWCEFTCDTDDDELANKLLAKLERVERLRQEFWKWWGILPIPGSRPQAIVSHPHGCYKRVTVGELNALHFTKDMYRYTVDTCKGCSGAPVIGWWCRRYAAHHCQRGPRPGVNVGFYCLG